MENITIRINNTEEELQGLIDKKRGSKIQFDIMEEDEAIGSIDFEYLFGLKEVILRYEINKDKRGKGYTYLAAKQAIDMLFELGLDKIATFVEYANVNHFAASSRILEKLGFNFRGDINEGGTLSFYELYNLKKEISPVENMTL